MHTPQLMNTFWQNSPPLLAETYDLAAGYPFRTIRRWKFNVLIHTLLNTIAILYKLFTPPQSRWQSFFTAELCCCYTLLTCFRLPRQTLRQTQTLAKQNSDVCVFLWETNSSVQYNRVSTPTCQYYVDDKERPVRILQY